MEKITAVGQFSPWSYVNSFHGMSGLSPVCGGIGGFEGFLLLTLGISSPFVDHVNRKTAVTAVVLTVLYPHNNKLQNKVIN